MSELIELSGYELASNSDLMNQLNDLCRDELLSTHCYLTYYTIHEPTGVKAVLLLSGGEVLSYVLIRYGGRFSIEDVYEVYVWRPNDDVLSRIDLIPNKRVDAQLSSDLISDADLIIKYLRRLGFRRFSVVDFHDMVCTLSTFRPSPNEYLATKLGEEHAELYRELELERGIELSTEEAREILRTYTHYGVITNEVLASVAARYVTNPTIHVIGGVFTRSRYRGRGYAKAVTSALTKEILNSGATAGLHVEVGNEVVKKLYESLGYHIIRTRKWVFAYP